MWISGTPYFLDGHLLAELDTHQPVDAASAVVCEVSRGLAVIVITLKSRQKR